ncbi:hypothetical protein [Levilactobacillus enshiensis]|uniref:hypothetical protein n=1 Tax=Levilactobacillus enshiensis TaxID=2590213 RepID=UPI00117A5F83|nr:hypothetical protein [Levilactobacillus enshiensis]
MKTTKLVTGIIMIIFAVFIFFQSMAVGVGDALEGGKHVSGTSGMFVAILYLASGIVYLATRKAEKMGGDIATFVMMILAWIIGLSDVGFYTDLQIWAWLAFIIGVGFFVWHIMANRKLKHISNN